MDGIVYVRDGHVFETDDEGLRKTYESGDYHSGPQCMVCGEFWCEHCHPGIYKEKCPDRFGTLPGLEYPQPPRVVGRRINL